MFNVVGNVFIVFFNVLKYPIYAFLILFLVFVVCCAFWFIFDLCNGKRLKKGKHIIVKKTSFLKRLFYDFPKQLIFDLFDKDPSFFNYHGCVIFEGRQGAGKTISMIEYARRMQKEYPLSLCTTNLCYKGENKELTDWRMLLNYSNDIYGVIVVLDELQNWFSCNDSKNFPPQMLEVITQNRKNRRIILGTAQNFYLLAKAIRSQATEVRRCSTLFGCLTIVRRFLPLLDSEGNVKEWKKLGSYFFVHDKELRNSYDTYKIIKRFSKVGFQEISQSEIINNNYNLIKTKK